MVSQIARRVPSRHAGGGCGEDRRGTQGRTGGI